MTLSVELSHKLSGFSLDISFNAPPGLTVLFGRSGSGKTTIANAVAGLLCPQAGRIAVEDHVLFDSAAQINIPTHQRRLGYIFQEARLFPHLNVRQNLTFGRWFTAKTNRSESFDRVVDLLGIGPLLSRQPGALSGGEKQRVAIGRALLADPKLIIADEPLAALDEQRKAEIIPYFERLRDEHAIPILYVSHSATEVARLATSVVALKDGKVARQGSAAEVLGDPTILPTGVRDAGAVLDAKVFAHHDDGLSELDANGTRFLVPQITHAKGTAVRLRIAAHDVILSSSKPQNLSALNIVKGEIIHLHTGNGPGAIVSLKTPAGTILARITRRSALALNLAPGAVCYAIIKSVAIAPQNVG